MRAIIVHGGAGTWPERRHADAHAGVREAVKAGYAKLAAGQSSLDACEAAVMSLEDNPLFNAGTGSVLTLDGRCEMDASIMVGATRQAGAVAGIERVQHPISVARKVMEHTDHVLLAGAGAQRFARAMGFSDYNPVIPARERNWKEFTKNMDENLAQDWPKLRAFLREHPEYLKGTVGCVAVDDSGTVVVGTSTGGMFLKLTGRVGDSPIIGAGTYAAESGGASATGIGESILRVLLAYQVVAALEGGTAPQAAANGAIASLERVLHKTAKNGAEAGVITLTRDGRWAFATNAPHMPVGVLVDGMAEPQSFL